METHELALDAAFALDGMVWELHPIEEAPTNPTEALANMKKILEELDDAYALKALKALDEANADAYKIICEFIYTLMDEDIYNLLG